MRYVVHVFMLLVGLASFAGLSFAVVSSLGATPPPERVAMRTGGQRHGNLGSRGHGRYQPALAGHKDRWGASGSAKAVGFGGRW